MAETSKGAETVTLSRVTCTSNSSSSSSVEGKFVIVTQRRDFCIYCEEGETIIVTPVQESGEPGNAELVITIITSIQVLSPP